MTLLLYNPIALETLFWRYLMNTHKFFLAFLFIIFSSNVAAYYGSSGGAHKSCTPPELIQFTPPHLSIVVPKSEFSFLAHKHTSPKSIVVTVKKQAVDVTINETEKGYIVSGKLPPSLQDTYARIEINATALNGCKGNNGWLLNIRNKEKRADEI
jgi:hypothetical protein